MEHTLSIQLPRGKTGTVTLLYERKYGDESDSNWHRSQGARTPQRLVWHKHVPCSEVVYFALKQQVVS